MLVAEEHGLEAHAASPVSSIAAATAAAGRRSNASAASRFDAGKEALVQSLALQRSARIADCPGRWVVDFLIDDHSLLCSASTNSATVLNVFAPFARPEPLVESVKRSMNIRSVVDLLINEYFSVMRR